MIGRPLAVLLAMAVVGALVRTGSGAEHWVARALGAVVLLLALVVVLVWFPLAMIAPRRRA